MRVLKTTGIYVIYTANIHIDSIQRTNKAALITYIPQIKVHHMIHVGRHLKNIYASNKYGATSFKLLTKVDIPSSAPTEEMDTEMNSNNPLNMNDDHRDYDADLTDLDIHRVLNGDKRLQHR